MPNSAILSTPSETQDAGTPREMAKQEFGRRLQRALIERRPDPWSQADLARASGLGRDAISTYIRGRSLPEPHSLKRIAAALGTTPEALMPDTVGLQGDSEIPALEIRQLAGHPDRIWLRVNQAVTLDQAAEVLGILRPHKSQAAE